MGVIEDGPGYGQKCCRCNVPVHCNVVHDREGQPLCLGCHLSPPPGRPPEQFTPVHSSERRLPIGVGDEVEKKGGGYSKEKTRMKEVEDGQQALPEPMTCDCCKLPLVKLYLHVQPPGRICHQCYFSRLSEWLRHSYLTEKTTDGRG